MSPRDDGKTEISDTFNYYFPKGKICGVQMADLPKIAINKFEGMSRRFILPEHYKKGNFKEFFKIDFEDGNQIYVTTQTKDEDLIYLIELDSEGNKLGHGEVRIDLDYDPTYPKPYCFVGYIETEWDYRKRGLGERRLKVMNALSQILYGSPLNSGETITYWSGQPFFKRLSEKGIVQVIKGKEEEEETYSFCE